MRTLHAADPAAIADAQRAGEYLWLDLRDPTDDDVARVGEALGLHPLAMEDTREFSQAPKLEPYDDWLLLVFYGARDAGELVENHIYVSATWLLTVRRDECVSLDELAGGTAGRDDPWVVYRVLDVLTDSFFGVLHRLDERVEDLEDRVLAGDPRTAQREVADLRRRVLALRRVLMAQRDTFDRAASQLATLPGLGAASETYFRDIQDHLRRLSEDADALRERLMGVLGMAENALGTQLSRVGERLTVIATIFVPLTILTGFFGMNFAWLTNGIDTLAAFLALGLGLPLLVGVGVFVVLRRGGYLD